MQLHGTFQVRDTTDGGIFFESKEKKVCSNDNHFANKTDSPKREESSDKMTSKPLNCRCDHCENETCTTDHFCYAEWTLTNYDELFGTGHRLPNNQQQQQQTRNPLYNAAAASATPATTTGPATITQQSLLSTFSAYNDLDLKRLNVTKRFNCFNKNDPIFIRTICNETATNTSHVIRRCCQTDRCNEREDLLPSEHDAKFEISKHLPDRIIGYPDDDNIFTHLVNQYSRLPLGLQIFIVFVSAILIGYALILVNKSSSNRPRRAARQQPTHYHSSQTSTSRRTPSTSANSNAFKRMLNRILLNIGRRASSLAGATVSAEGTTFMSGSGSVRRPKRGTGATTNISSGTGQSRLGGVEDGSEHSSKAISEGIGFDTNSMASREPLIGRQSTTGLSHTPNSTMNQQHSGPYMEDVTTNCKTSIQMTLGSAACTTLKQDTSSGSGAGQPYLTQRSIAHDIELVEVVGRGFFGIVWRGEYKGEPVAVKIFSPVAESSWEREAEIYQTTMLRHKNILGFIATDKRHDASLIGYWLVTDYYPMGSLYDFLKEQTMSMSDAIRMAISIANGLSHLHIEIFGTRGKPAIAHRDLKSKNILVKNDGTCCIADLGMAVRHSSRTGVVDVPTNSRIGTRRYLAPEILDSKLNLMDFEAVKATDIYALGLVLWEIIRRSCLIHPSSNEDVENQNYGPVQQVTSPTSPSRSSSASPRDPGGFTGAIDLPTGPEQPQAGPSGLNVVHSSTSISSEPEERKSDMNLPPIMPPQQTIGLAQTYQQQQYLPSVQVPQAATSVGMPQESFDTTLEEQNHDLALVCEPYEVPYQHHVTMDPSTEEMREVVCVRKIRPDLSARWSKFASMRDYVTLMTECWYEKPQARLSALRVRKSLSNVAKKYFNLNMEYD